MPVKIGETISLDSLNTGQVDLVKTFQPSTSPIKVGDTIPLSELKGPRQGSPDVGVTPPSPAEGSFPPPTQEGEVGDVWQRGLAGLQQGLGDLTHLLNAWGSDVSKATGIPKPAIGGQIENWFLEKAGENIAEAAPATGIYSRAPENFLGYLDPKRMYKVAAENVPLMGAFVAATIANPVAGTALMFGVEGGSARRTLDEYEASGQEVNPILKQVVPIIVGAINAALEKTGINRILKTAGIRGLKSKLTNIAISSLVEGTTEGAQELVQAVAEATYHELPKDTGERLIESFYAGLVLGLGGASTTAAVSGIGASPTPIDKPTPTPTEEVVEKTIEEEVQPEKEFSVPELKGTTEALKYGQLNIEDEEVPLWKAEIEKTFAEIEGSIHPSNKQESTILRPGEDTYTVYGEDFELGTKKSALEVLDEIIVAEPQTETVKDFEQQEVYKILAEKLKTIVPPQLQVYTILDGKGMAQYNPNYGGIFYDPVPYRENTNRTKDMLLHEMIHYLTNRPFEEFADNLTPAELEYSNDMQALYKEVRDQLVPPLMEKLKIGQDRSSGDLVFFEEYHNYPKGIQRVLYALQKRRSPSEFVSIGLTEPTLQEMLSTIKVEGQDITLWDKFLIAIRRLLSLSQEEVSDTALQKFIDINYKYFGEGNAPIDERIQASYKLQMMKEALGAKLEKHLNYNKEEGFIETDETDFMREERFKSIYKMSVEDAINWAHSQIDSDAWIKYFIEEGPNPEAIEHNYGNDVMQSILEDEVTNTPEQTDEEIRYEKPKHIGQMAQWFRTPLFNLKEKARAMKDAFYVIRGEQKLNHIITEYTAWYKTLWHKLKKGDREVVREAMDLAYKMKGSFRTPAELAIAKEKLAKIYAKHPRVQGVIAGRKGKGGIIELFEYVKKRYQESLREQKRIKLTEEENSIIDEVLVNNKKLLAERENIDLLIERNIEELYDLDQLARENIDGRLGLGTWADLTQGKKAKQKNIIKRGLVSKLKKEAEEVRSIDDWGLHDYISNIELGSYRIVDRAGSTQGFGRTAAEAKKKAYAIRKEQKAKGEEAPWLGVQASFNPIAPTKTRKNVLAGEVDILKVLPRYIYAMEKRIIMQPIVEQYNANVKEFPEEYTADVRNIIQTQIDYVLGARYSWGNIVVDQISTAFGWETGKYGKNVMRSRKFIANTKLGYRPVANFVNLFCGFGNTWVAVGNKFFVGARAVLHSGTYTAPDGEVIDFAAKMTQIEEDAALGIDFTVGEGGAIETRVPLWKPLGGFQLPEQFIRPHGFTANYMYQREVLGLNDFEATEAALINLYFQNFAYSLSAIPHAFRSDTGKLIFQFKTYLVGQLQFMSTLRGNQIARMVGLQLMMAGPRGAIYLLKSIPILGAMGLLDDAEEWLVKKKGPLADFATRGIAGMFGADISAPATFQLPNKPEDWGGPALGEMVRFYKEIIIPNLQLAASKVSDRPAPAYVKDGVIDWALGLSPMIYYLKDLESSVNGAYIWEELKQGQLNKAARDLMENFQKPNIWVRDSRGNKAYKVGGMQDRILLSLGAAPTEKSQNQVLQSIWLRDEKIRSDNRSKWYGKVINSLLDGVEMDEDMWNDALLYGVDPNQIPKAYQYKQMTPRQRQTMKANLFNKIEAWDHFGVD